MTSPQQGPGSTEAFQLQVEHMASTRPLNVPDIFQRAFFQALVDRLGDSNFPVLNTLIAEALETHPARTVKNIADNIQRCDNNYNLRLSTPGWPLGHHSARAKSQFFEDLEAQSQEQKHFQKNIELNVQTNVPDRGLLLKAAALLLGHKGPVSMLDIGCSRHHISKKIGAPGSHPYAAYRPIDVMNTIHEQEANHAASSRFNNLINNTDLPIGSSIGIDLQDMLIGTTKREHDKMREWARSCFYTSEYLYDFDRIREFDAWEETYLKEVKFFQGDITAFDHDQFRHYFPETRGYDIAYFSTVGYQLGAEGMKAAIENVKPYLRPDGLILLQDFVEVQDNNRLNFLTNWSKGSYALYGLDLAREEEGFQKYFTVASGRIGKVALEPALSKTPAAHALGLHVVAEF